MKSYPPVEVFITETTNKIRRMTLEEMYDFDFFSGTQWTKEDVDKMTKISRHLPWYRPGLWQRAKEWALGQRCELPLDQPPKPCNRRAIGRFALAQEFGTVQGDLCQRCLDRKLDEIRLSEWGQYEAKQKGNIRGDKNGPHVMATWATTLKTYKPNWVGRLLLALGLDG